MGTKKDNKNTAITSGASNCGYKGNKKLTGGNTSLQGKVFEISSHDAMHQYTETVKAIIEVQDRSIHMEGTSDS
jgi:hypothetical protein